MCIEIRKTSTLSAFRNQDLPQVLQRCLSGKTPLHDHSPHDGPAASPPENAPSASPAAIFSAAPIPAPAANCRGLPRSNTRSSVRIQHPTPH
uniref:Uncharacterized protein n=1 Tax=uncultured organism TaxID=155900 RepID=Q1ZZJ3_9ZZZZ|nr:unknown [uncultured organism]